MRRSFRSQGHPSIVQQSRRRVLRVEQCETRITPDAGATLTTAVPLGLIGTTAITRSDSVSSASDIDLFKFSVTAGQRLGFDIDTPLNGPPGLGSYIRLFDQAGRELAANNDRRAPGDAPPGAGAGSDGFDSYIDYHFWTTGTYYLGVTNWQHRYYNANTGTPAVGSDPRWLTGAYTLVIRDLSPPDPDDQISEAINLGRPTTSSIQRSGQITLGTDVDMFKFTVTKGQRIGFDIDTATNGPGGLGSYLRIFDGSGNQLAANNDAVAPDDPLRPANSPVGFDSYIEYTFNQAGTYYVGVSNWQNISYSATTGTDALGSTTNYLTGNYSLILRDYTYFVTKVPDIMGHLGWTHAKKLQQIWFSAPARRATVDILPINNTIVKMQWILGYERAKKVYDDLIKNYANSAAQTELKLQLEAKFKSTNANTISFGQFNTTGNALHQQHINFRTVDDTQLDDLGGTLGRFNFHVIPKGTATKTNKGIEVTITDIGVYVRDSFDFEGFQLLGFWETPNRVSKWPSLTATGVYNSDYAAYRTATNKGGDFLVFSDVMVTRLTTPTKLLLS